jgi:hypothetical protein
MCVGVFTPPFGDVLGAAEQWAVRKGEGMGTISVRSAASASYVRSGEVKGLTGKGFCRCLCVLGMRKGAGLHGTLTCVCYFVETRITGEAN